MGSSSAVGIVASTAISGAVLHLIARDADDAAREAARLGQAGLRALPAPVLTFTPVPLDLVALVAALGPEADLLVGSPRAAAALDGASIPPGWRVLALAPRSAQALRALGQPVHQEVWGGGRALARAARPGALGVLCSDLGGDEVLAERPDARRVVVYRTGCPATLPLEVTEALACHRRYTIHLGSPSAVDHLERLHPGALAGAFAVYARGATTVRALQARGVCALPPLEIPLQTG